MADQPGKAAGFPGVTFASELQDGSHLGNTLYKELLQLTSQWAGFLQALGVNPDATFNNIIANSLTTVQNYNFPLPPTVPPAPGSVVSVSPNGTVTDCCSGGSGTCPDIPITAGALAFSGFGDADIQFVAPDGTILPQPVPPRRVGVSGGSCDGIVALANGRIAISGGDGGPPDDFTSFVYDPTIQTILGGESTSISSSIQWNYAGHFYVYLTPVPGNNYKLKKYSISGALIATYDMGFNAFPFFGPMAVAPDQSFGYWARAQTGGTPVKQFDLAGGVVDLFSLANYKLVGDCSMMCLMDGTLLVGWDSTTGAAGLLNLYDNTGALIRTVMTLANGDSPIILTPGLDPSKTVWMSYYGSASTWSGVTVIEIDIATGDILNSFDPEVGSFDFDGPFCVLRAPIPA